MTKRVLPRKHPDNSLHVVPQTCANSDGDGKCIHLIQETMQFRTRFSALSRVKNCCHNPELIGVMDVGFKLTWELRHFVIRTACLAGGSRLLAHGAQRRKAPRRDVAPAPSVCLVIARQISELWSYEEQ